jgi:hypothetical protein
LPLGRAKITEMVSTNADHHQRIFNSAFDEFSPAPYISFLPLDIPILPLEKTSKCVFRSFSSLNLKKNRKIHSEIFFPKRKKFRKRIPKYLFKGKKED